MKKVYHALSTDTPYAKDDVVDGFIYEISDEYGAYVAVDGKYSARIAPQEIRGALSAGRRITARVARVLPDGKMDLTLQKKVADQMTDDAEAVLSEIRARGGSLPFTDKADAEVIREAFGMSKNAFKRAVGRLLKQGKIAIDTDQIRMK